MNFYKAHSVADWLCLAAAPSFALMALLTRLLGSDAMICSATPNASTMTGMVPMYLLMSIFHTTPWLKMFGPKRPI